MVVAWTKGVLEEAGRRLQIRRESFFLKFFSPKFSKCSDLSMVGWIYSYTCTCTFVSQGHLTGAWGQRRWERKKWVGEC